PSNERAWLPDVARTPTAVQEGSVVTLASVRDFDYRSETDYDERWATRRYDLAALRGLDLFVCYWGPRLYAHRTRGVPPPLRPRRAPRARPVRLLLGADALRAHDPELRVRGRARARGL